MIGCATFTSLFSESEVYGVNVTCIFCKWHFMSNAASTEGYLSVSDVTKKQLLLCYCCLQGQLCSLCLWFWPKQKTSSYPRATTVCRHIFQHFSKSKKSSCSLGVVVGGGGVSGIRPPPPPTPPLNFNLTFLT